jgi:putative membrane protein
MIAKWLRNYLHEDDLAKISAAVQQAESHTVGEIVPTIVRSSSAVGHVPLILFLAIFSLVLVGDEAVNTLWAHPWEYAIVGGALFGLIGSLGLARCLWVQRHLTSRHDLHHQVAVRAQLEFYRADISHTSGKIGVLIFLSMMERQALVLADKSIADKLPPETWDRVVALVVAGIQRQQLAHGLQQAIEAVGEILQAHFPQAQHSVNEVSNELVIKE